MFRYHALGGVSLLVLCTALLPSTPHAQTAAQSLAAGNCRRAACSGDEASGEKAEHPRPSARTQVRPPSANTTPAVSQARGRYPECGARAALSGAGRPDRDDGRSQPVRQPAGVFGRGLLRDSPGISIKQGNGPRDFGISIRGSNARNGFGIRNLVIFDDGFPVTQPDGLSRSDLIDPHAYGAIDVIRGPSSALYGNYATGGALNFRTRPGGTIDGVEYGVDGGSFGYLNNYLAAGKKVGNFEGSLFASDARGDGFIGNSWFNTQTVNFLATLQATPDDRFTVKLINNDLSTRLPIRLSLNQFYQNPFQQGCAIGATAALGCGTVTLFNNGFNARPARTPKRRCRRALAATIAAPSSAVAGSTISTTRRPGATSSCSTTGTSTSRPARPARSATSRPTTT